jgi:hypothetical protein
LFSQKYTNEQKFPGGGIFFISKFSPATKLLGGEHYFNFLNLRPSCLVGQFSQDFGPNAVRRRTFD